MEWNVARDLSQVLAAKKRVHGCHQRYPDKGWAPGKKLGLMPGKEGKRRNNQAEIGGTKRGRLSKREARLEIQPRSRLGKVLWTVGRDSDMNELQTSLKRLPFNTNQAFYGRTGLRELNVHATRQLLRLRIMSGTYPSAYLARQIGMFRGDLL